MKKIISILLVTVMVLSCTAVFADNDASKAMETVLLNVKSKVDIPGEYTEFSPYAYDENGKTNYTFSWAKEDGNAHIEVSCDEQGRINRYYFYDNLLKSEKKLTSLSKGDIVKFAENFLQRALPEVYADAEAFEFDAESWFVSNNTYRLTFRRYSGMKEVKDNYADLRIVVYDDIPYIRNMNVNYNYDAKWTTKTPDATGEHHYINVFPMELIYKDVNSYNNEDDENKTVLVYRSKDADYGFVSAVYPYDRVYEDESENIIFGGSGGGILRDEAAVETNKNMLTEQEIKELANVEGLISKDEAQKYLKSLPYVSIDSDMELASYNITKSDEKYIVSLRYETSNKDDYKYLTASFDGESGKVLSLYSGGKYDYESNELTDKQKEDASEKVDEFLKAVAPEESAQCREQEINGYNNECSFDFDRYVNDIRYIDDGINVTFNVKTNKITSYRLDFETDKVFDDASNVISNNMATKCLFDITTIKCIWVLSGGEYIPCFTLKEYGTLIDAFTGEEYKEEIYHEQKNYEYSDIKGHWAEDKITKLAEIQIGFDGDKFNPDAPISQYDLLRLFAAGIHYQDYLTYPQDMLYENFIHDGILAEEEKNPDGKVLREDAFVYMVRLDGLDKVAKLSNIFKVEYADENLLSEGKIGYPAILTGMNVICGNGGYLKPKTPITRAEAVVMVYNYMINEN